MSAVDRPQGTGSAILTSFTMAMAKEKGRWKLERKKGTLTDSLLSALKLECRMAKGAKEMAKVSRTDSPMPPYLTTAGGRIRCGGSKSTALNAVDIAISAS